MTLPEVVPLFPLPNAVLFPRMALPLHVFEPRYRALVRDALRGARVIGMVLLRGEWREQYYGRPPIFATGTAGEVVHVEELADGRFNIVLRGAREFVVDEELAGRAAYREARVRWREAAEGEIDGEMRRALVDIVQRYLARVGRMPTAPGALDRNVDGTTLVNSFAQHLDLDPLERQALLEEPRLEGRARRLRDVLEFRLRELAAPNAGSTGRPH